MSVISVKPNTRGSRAPIIGETSEYDGLWINVGVHMAAAEGSDADPAFVRLPRGVAVSDLKERKIYDNMDPEFAGQANLMNQLIQEIRKKSLTLAEGESCPINLEVTLYRRQEESTQTETPMANADLAAALFA
jgi:hypothetical protein